MIKEDLLFIIKNALESDLISKSEKQEILEYLVISNKRAEEITDTLRDYLDAKLRQMMSI